MRSFVVLILFQFFFISCSEKERQLPVQNCNCGIIIETTTGDRGNNPFPTKCGGTNLSGTDNGRLRVKNHCSDNIRVVCTGPVTLTVKGALHGYPLNSEWCDPNSNDSW